MLSDEVGRKLHDKSTRGKVLTAKEHEFLEKWYAEQDKAESKMLHGNTVIGTKNSMQKQIDTILARIGTAAEQIKKLTDENRALRTNIAKLQRNLGEG